MKRSRIDRVVLIAMAFNFGASNVAFASKATEPVRDYSMRMKEAADQFIAMAKSKKATTQQVLKNEHFEIIANTFGLSSGDRALLAQAIAGGRTEIVTALYSGIAAQKLFEANNIQFKDVGDSLVGFTKVASMATAGVARNQNLKVTAAERVELNAALKKKLSYSIEMLQWSKKEIESHTEIMTKTSELFSSQKLTPEEALLMAIMQVKGLDKEAAMKIVGRLKECV